MKIYVVKEYYIIPFLYERSFKSVSVNSEFTPVYLTWYVALHAAIAEDLIKAVVAIMSLL